MVRLGAEQATSYSTALQTFDGLVYWRIYASFGVEALKDHTTRIPKTRFK